LLLSLKSNKLGTKEAGEVLGDMLKGNSVLNELDLSGNWVHSSSGGDATAFAQGISKGLLGNGALTKLDISNNNIEQGQALQQITECCSTKVIELTSNAQ
jgi:hypothetical protein